MQKKYYVSGVWRTGVPKRMRRRTTAQELEMVRCDAATAWDKCEERRVTEELLKSLVAELLDDPLILDGAPPGIGWFERAEAAIGRPIGSSFDNAAAKKRRGTPSIGAEPLKPRRGD